MLGWGSLAHFYSRPDVDNRINAHAQPHHRFLHFRLLLLTSDRWSCGPEWQSQYPGCRVVRVTMFHSNRKDSAIRTLVAETLVLAKTHGYVEKIEHELEEELQRESTLPPNRILAKWRRKGETLLKNKYTLLTVALFCVLECALILGELILDLHKVKVVLEAQNSESHVFVQRLHNLYPKLIHQDLPLSEVYQQILGARISWAHTSNISQVQPTVIIDLRPGHKSLTYQEETILVLPPRNFSHVPGVSQSSLTREEGVNRDEEETRGYSLGTQEDSNEGGAWLAGEVKDSRQSPVPSGSPLLVNNSRPMVNFGHRMVSHGHSLKENIAHAFHMASITILSILVFETILKALCAGAAFFHRKLETFDLVIVLVSFTVDLVCMQIMPRYEIQDFVFILAFLLPWRVIRVVNSLVVAVQDHEHFRLKLIYGRKKKILNSLRESEIKLQLFRAQCNALKRLCYSEGVEESKIDNIMMVEECIVNKAGKSKCKIKIDNSSVILLNDKSDFPRLSPRPSLLSLVEKPGRRKSIQPPGLALSDRDFYLSTKDTCKRGILKSRARSNSESGHGTLSSPEDGPATQNSFEGVGAYSGLSTPIIINRKSSLSSPLMVSHVRNILNSLEDKVNQMNGSSSRLVGGRGSVDTDSIPEEEVEETTQRKPLNRHVMSIEERTESSTNVDCKIISYLAKRRASLQPQKCVDEDDVDGLGDRTPGSNLLVGTSPKNMATVEVESSSNKLDRSSQKSAQAAVAKVKLHTFIPTTIQIDPPSVNSNYSLSSSESNHSNTSNEMPRDIRTRTSHSETSTTLSGISGNSSMPPDLQARNNNQVRCNTSPTESTPVSSCNFTVTTQDSGMCLTSVVLQSSSMSSSKAIPSTATLQRDVTAAPSNLKPKTLRTPSDIENQNSLTTCDSLEQSDTNICDSYVKDQNYDTCIKDQLSKDPTNICDNSRDSTVTTTESDHCSTDCKNCTDAHVDNSQEVCRHNSQEACTRITHQYDNCKGAVFESCLGSVAVDDHVDNCDISRTVLDTSNRTGQSGSVTSCIS